MICSMYEFLKYLKAKSNRVRNKVKLNSITPVMDVYIISLYKCRLVCVDKNPYRGLNGKICITIYKGWASNTSCVYDNEQ